MSQKPPKMLFFALITGVIIFLVACKRPDDSGGSPAAETEEATADPVESTTDPETSPSTPETPPAFSLGGQVFGLSGGGLILHNNDGNDLSIASNGPFVFSTALSTGAAYDVRVSSQPTSPTQICTLSRGSGIVSGEPITDIIVSCVLPDVQFDLKPFASGFDSPVGIYNAGPGDPRLFVIEKGGRIRIIHPEGTVPATPFLDISTRVTDSGEQGLLGLAFHPDFAFNGFFYLNYIHTEDQRRTRISRFRVTQNPDIADPNSEMVLLTVDQPFANHNAGDIHFGPDGFLYIPLGDGGSGGDPDNHAQTTDTLLGKVVRIDVDSGPGRSPDCVGAGGGQYTVPASNPFIDGTGGVCDEIWALGLRNPWRSSFDRLTGDFFIADVGQNNFEELNIQMAGSLGGENYGWRCYEGNAVFNLSRCDAQASYAFPVFDYDHRNGECTIIGGYSYRGALFPALFGHYVFTDFCTGDFWDITPDGRGGWQTTRHDHLKRFGYVSFGEDANGELYVVYQDNGTILRLEGMP